jgi:hypothetical protein
VPSIFLPVVRKVVRPAITESVRLEAICRLEIASDVIRARLSEIRGRGKGEGVREKLGVVQWD